ncbi:GyrI-like domain-containing protein [Bacillus sp. 2205SS5-2]|uniref:GyrI-like domain-containing protein n=1 Tax=Bacillus sp. 2205SS5-2 TaxID=3109031 RepID=UPI0030041247
MELTRLNEFKVIGFKWEGTFEEAQLGGIKELFSKLSDLKQDEINREVYGVSNNHHENGFAYYVGYAVQDDEEIDLESIIVPKMQYASMQHSGTDVMSSYKKLYRWVEEQGFQPRVDNIQHVEIYPIGYNPYRDAPEMEILLPLKSEEI